MIARALLAINNPRGCKPKDIFSWMEANIPGLSENFRASATQALKKGVDKSRFLRIDNGWYKHNDAYEEPLKKKKEEHEKDDDTERKDDRSLHQQTAAAALASMGSVMPQPHLAHLPQMPQGLAQGMQPGMPQGLPQGMLHPGFQLPPGIPPHMMMHPQHLMHYPMPPFGHPQQQWQEEQQGDNNEESIF
jgi:hypothetical protein